MHQLKLKQRTLALCLALVPLFGFAAGLGKLNVNSSLGEPLKAEIELLSVTPEELASLSAAVAPEEAYAIQGIPRLGIHSDIKVELSKKEDGSHVLKLHTHLPVSDPYLDMLIQVDWSSGRLLREYTILLDPPEYQQNIKNANAEESFVQQPTLATPDERASTSDKPATTKPAVKKYAAHAKKAESVSSKPADSVNANEMAADAPQVKTKQGDSLVSIARSYQSEGVSLDQMLVGLFEANKHAFVAGNMNRLKVGQILAVPSREVLTAVDPNRASQEVRVHSANWNAYRNSLAANVAHAQTTDSSESKQSVSGKVTSAEDQAALNKAGPQDVIKLSAGNTSNKSNGKVDATDSKLLAMQEEAIARDKALKEAQERTALLEAQIADMKKLLALKNQALANIQNSAEKSDQSNQPVADKSLAEKADSTASTDVQAKAQTSEVINPAGKAASGKPVPKQPPLTPQASEDLVTEPSLIDFVQQSLHLKVLAAAVGIALLMGVWAYIRNRRRKLLDTFERSILGTGGLNGNALSSDTHKAKSDAELLPGLAHSVDGSMIDTSDVDPIAEAEVYMAYGRDAQAEEILKDAVAKEPQRYELHLKLMEIYSGKNDISAFDAMAGELYTALGASHPIWVKVAEMGAKLEPDNPLYDLSHLPASTDLAKMDNDLTESLAEIESLVSNQDELAAEDSVTALNASTSAIPETPVVTEASDQKSGSDNALDFDFSAMQAFVANADNVSGSNREASIESNNLGSALEAGIESSVTASVSPLSLSDNDQLKVSDDEVTRFDQSQSSNDVISEKQQDVEVADLGFEKINFTEGAEQHPALAALQEIDLNFGDTENAPVPKNNRVEEIQFDFPVPEISESESESAKEVPLSSPESAGKAYDLSSINLDLNDDISAETAKVSQNDAGLAMANEPPESLDVDIKLDLVKVYIDMDDTVGARELLQEVLKEGSVKQRERAEQLLASIS